MIFPKWKHLWTYGMVDEPMCSSFLETWHSRLCCYAIKCPCLWASPRLESSKSCFRLNHLGRTWKQWCVWCCLMFPINVGRTNVYIYINTYAAASSICFYMLICRHEDSPDEFQFLWYVAIFADLPQNRKQWLVLCAKFQVLLCRGISPLPIEGLILKLKGWCDGIWWNSTCGKDSSSRLWLQILLDGTIVGKMPLRKQPPQQFHQCEALKILWPTLNKEFKQWNTRQKSWNGSKVVQQIVWKQLGFLDQENIVLWSKSTDAVETTSCYAPSRVRVRCI